MIYQEPTVFPRRRIIKGKVYHDWMSYCGSMAGRKFRFCGQTKTIALQKARAFLSRYRKGDGIFESRLYGRRLFDALHALALLAECNASISLTELARAHCRVVRQKGCSRGDISLGELFRRHAESLSPDAERNRDGYRWTARTFCGGLGEKTLVEQIAPEDLKRILARYSSSVSRNALLRRLHAVFRWGVREGLIRFSPAEGLRYSQQPYSEPAFFLPEQVQRIFRIAETHPGLPEQGIGVYLTLGFFAGVRTAEILRADWEDLDLKGRTLRIPKPKGYLKGSRPRLIELEENTCAWLRYWKRHYEQQGFCCSGRMVSNARSLTTWKKLYLEPEGISWGRLDHHNVMRHTYATMHVGAFRNAPETALNLGHSRSTELLERHYRGLVAQDVARPYWSILPCAQVASQSGGPTAGGEASHPGRRDGRPPGLPAPARKSAWDF